MAYSVSKAAGKSTFVTACESPGLKCGRLALDEMPRHYTGSENSSQCHSTWSVDDRLGEC